MIRWRSKEIEFIPGGYMYLQLLAYLLSTWMSFFNAQNKLLLGY